MDNFFQTDLDALGFVDEPEYATTRATTRESRKGTYVVSEQVGANISAALKGRKLSAEHRANLSAAFKGRVSPYKGRKGHKHSAEARAKMSAARMGRVSPTKGRKLSAEHRAKISATKKKRKEQV